MSNLHVKYLLVGGGLASSEAARAIRSADAEGSVLLVGQEINRPYRRSALPTDYLLRKIARDSLFTFEPGWFERHHVELRTGRRVSALDTARQAAVLDNGQEVSFDRLLLATGAVPRALDVPGARLPNLYYLRTLEDADRLHHAAEQARHEGRAHARGRGKVVVVGAGLLGVELAETLTRLGLSVDLLAAHPHPWHRFAGETVGRVLTAHLQKNGVTVHLNAPARRLEGDGRVQRVVAGDGEALACDFAVGAVGLAANKELLRGTPIAAGKAILVDGHCQTNVPDVFAAGDCASVFDSRFGKHRGQAHLDDAAGTGALAGRNMAGVAETYSSTAAFAADVFGLPARAWGEARLVAHRIVRSSQGLPAGNDSPQLIEFGVAADGRLAQVVSLGAAESDELLGELVARRTRVDGSEEALKDPSAPLANLLC